MDIVGVVGQPWAKGGLGRWTNGGRSRFRDRGGVIVGRAALAISATLLFACGVHAQAQDASAEEDVESARAELLKRWESDGLVKPRDVDAMAKAILDRPLAEQAGEDLEALAKRANAAANFVGHVLEEYQDYYRENYRYDLSRKRSRRSTMRMWRCRIV